MADHSFWLSVFGAVTGFAGLILHFWGYLQGRPRVSIHVPSNDRGKIRLGFVQDYSRRNDCGEPHTDKSKCTLYQWIRIGNQSEKPITVLEFRLLVPKHGHFTLDSASTCDNWIPLDKGSSQSAAPLLKPILTIEPYSAIEGNLFFGPTSYIPVDGAKAILTTKTTRKAFKTKFRILVDRTTEELFEIEQLGCTKSIPNKEEATAL